MSAGSINPSTGPSGARVMVSTGDITVDLVIDPAYGGQGVDANRPREVQGLAFVAHPHPLFGGNRDNKVVMTIARGLTSQGLHVLRPNSRGVGATTGVYDEGRGETQDLFSLVEQCSSSSAPEWWPKLDSLSWPKTNQRLLAGFSFGAFVQTRVAEKLGNSPVMILAGLAASRFPVATVGTDVLVVHGELDDVVPLADVLAWARPQSLPVVVIPGAGHFFHGQLVNLKALVNDFVTARYNSRITDR
jgi:uncharacterized protein